MNKKIVYVDTDVSLGTPGAEIDDGAALIFLLRNKLIEVAGASSVFGNVSVRDATHNLDRLLTWLGAGHVPLGAGAERPICADMAWFEEWQSQYGQTLAWKPRSTVIGAAQLMIDLIHRYPGQVSILALGPMTNLALAATLDPTIIPLTQEVVVMGGSFNPQNPISEFNVHCDPEAAQVVFSCGWNVSVLGLDITRQVHFSRRDFACLPDGNPAVELLRAQAPGWIDRIEAMGWDRDGCGLHDAVAAAYMGDETIFKRQESSVEVELTAPGRRGITRFSPAASGHPVARVITSLDVNTCRDLIWAHLQP
jgi:purine nucleosidase